ncbi:MAG: MBL fold metallo-hydrolase [Flavobacteriales bacterium]|nr:MBL fold metallo-hydrolase [Flavobacteriales bacterium]
MKLYSINTGYFKLDGGAMFGVVPKSIWQKTNPADENNMCDWAMRSLLVEDGDRLILFDCGIGNKQSEKFFSYYYLHGEDSLEKNLVKHGFSKADITDVFLSHLHFDHCGGAVEREGDELKVVFPNATFWSNKGHWEAATEPNAREKASFLKENILPIQESGQLKMVQRKDDFTDNALPNIDVLFVDGHTESQMIAHIHYNEKVIVFVADLLPSVGHIPLPYVMGYDTRPLITLSEKKRFLERAADENYILFLEHDPENECCTVKRTEKGIRLDQKFDLASVL